MFKVLHRLLVFLGRSFCLEGAEISSFTRLPIFLAGIQPILAGFQLSDRKNFSAVHVWPLQILPSRVCSSERTTLYHIRKPNGPRAPLDRDEILWGTKGQLLLWPYLEKKAQAARREFRH